MQSEINDEFFGVLKQDGPEYHTATILFSPDKIIEVTIETQDVEDLDSLLETAQRTFLSIQAKRDVILRAIVDELFPTPKNGWVAGLVTEEKFLACIRLDNIEIWRDGASSANYDSVGLEEFFGDYYISVKLDPEGAIKRVGFVG